MEERQKVLAKVWKTDLPKNDMRRTEKEKKQIQFRVHDQNLPKTELVNNIG